MEIAGHTERINFIKILNNENFATGSNDNTIKLWNIRTGQLLCTLPSQGTDILTLEVTPLNHLAAGSRNG